MEILVKKLDSPVLRRYLGKSSGKRASGEPSSAVKSESRWSPVVFRRNANRSSLKRESGSVSRLSSGTASPPSSGTASPSSGTQGQSPLMTRQTSGRRKHVPRRASISL
jgi:hypothetical protein